MTDLGHTQSNVGRLIGKDQTWISQSLLDRADQTIRRLFVKEPSVLVRLLEVLEWSFADLQRETGIEFPLVDIGMPQTPRPREAAIREDVVRIPFRGVAAAGTAPDPEATIEIPRKFARSGAALYVTQGESMTPTFEDGDTLLVDETLRVTRNNGVYAIRLAGNGVQIRRCFLLAGQVVFVPDNATGAFPSYNLEDDEIEVLGQVYSVLSARPI